MTDTLTNADIIKNSLFEKYRQLLSSSRAYQEEEELNRECLRYYNTTWFDVFEKDNDCIKKWQTEKGSGANKQTFIDRFMYAFALINFGRQENNDFVSSLTLIYKRCINQQNELSNLTNLIENICSYAKTYKEFFLDDFTQKNINKNDYFARSMLLTDFLKQRTYDAFFLKVKHQQQDETEKQRIYKNFESWFVRNLVCHTIDSRNNVRNYVIHMLNDFSFLETINENNTVENTKIGLKAIKSNDLGRIILYLIELNKQNENGATEIRPISKFQLEHIMPQKWAEHWSNVNTYNEHGELLTDNDAIKTERNQSIFKIGNMLLLMSKPNKEFSNRPFDEKKNGFNRANRTQVSGYNILCQGLWIYEDSIAQTEEWTEKEINARTESLCNEFMNIWL